MLNRKPQTGDRTRISSSSLVSNSLSRKHRPDYALIIIALLLCVIGLIVVYAISPGLAATKNVDTNYFVIKQSIAICLGLIAFTVFSMLPYKHLPSIRNSLIGLSVIGAIAVQAFGEEVNGAYRWIQIGGLSFQIAELIKFALIVWLASFLVERLRQGEMDDNKKTLRPLLILMALIGIIVAKLESDLGSTGVMIAIIAIMAFVAGLPLKRIAIIGAVVIIGTTLAISTSAYRRDRVATFLNPTRDCQDSGYQACQALIAVGSGGVFGLGLGKSVQAYGYLPEAANDSIFAVLAEKFGFLGVTAVIGLYIALFARLKRIIERTAEPFARLFVIGVLAWLSTQGMINIGAMIGVIPLKGITLPFVSYGGTSILFVMAALGVVFQISRFTSFEPVRNSRIGNREYENEDSISRRRVRRPYYATASRRT
jgi:cell division protein FtsW